ncbi:unnamed protein product [Spirodela intermedia]|uniref:Uncharacterized protein n=1 Tax=Spirodela intermedia TaxID=51605 RepID=A0A7I8J572_SPIIN|nr:unnamed protein product [Spirodela intermedia]CAA6665386.1 unnamed protein product [Spirodela intermedia]
MDQETALELVKKGATLLLLDVPPFTLFGIDTQGIKMIPPGPHFIYYSPANRDGNEFSPIIGFFIFTSPSEVVVFKWHPQEEHLHFGEWKQISNYITKDTVDRLEPLDGEITIAYETNLIDTVHRTSAEKKLAEQLRNSKFSKPSNESPMRGCYYTSIPAVVKYKGKSREELTALNLDKQMFVTLWFLNIHFYDFSYCNSLNSYFIAISDTVTGNYSDERIWGVEDLLLGELQFAFIAFLMGQSLQAFYQWKSLVSLIFSCTEAPFQTRTHLFSKFIRVIYYQLKHGFQKNNGSKGDGDLGVSLSLDDAWASKDSFLSHHCKDFFSLVEQAPVVNGDLLSWTRKLRELLERELGWDLQGDPEGDVGDEYSPVVVLPDELGPGEPSLI